MEILEREVIKNAARSEIRCCSGFVRGLRTILMWWMFEDVD